ncbi:MAG: portal protein, partial [Novosphingobium sp.]|nr:portal protein [Novosphingobium sp.]
MANNKPTIFQSLNNTITNNWNYKQQSKNVNTYNYPSDSVVLLKTKDKKEYENAKLQSLQNRFLSDQWIKTGESLFMDNIASVSYLKAMYRDADLMDTHSEIGATLTTLAEECCVLNDKGNMLNIYSKSSRIKEVLEDLFINRLQIHINLPMIIRTMCKYGNNYYLLKITTDNGVTNWKQLPVYEIERNDATITSSYISLNSYQNGNELDLEYIWSGKQNEVTSFKSWQIAHFRLLIDSAFLPYGSSVLLKGRRDWRRLVMMEDLMLIYRLERSIERRVFKIPVGNMDPNDVTPYIQGVANTFKRTPLVDPQTGQLDLKRCVIGVDQDMFIPIHTSAESVTIEPLSAAQNPTSMDDIKFVQNKLFTALEVPKSFIGYEEEKGNGDNLSMLDIRFARKVNRIQQYVISELNKIAAIHLRLLGFEDDLTNFTITMNNPSTQLELLRIEAIGKKLSVFKEAVSDPGGGIPAMSWKHAMKNVLNYSEEEISEILNEIRLEKALAGELDRTQEIIKRTGIFDATDKIYGEADAEYKDQDGEDEEGGDDFGGGGGSFGGGFDDFGGGDMGGDMEGDEGSSDIGDDMGGEMPDMGDEMPDMSDTPP